MARGIENLSYEHIQHINGDSGGAQLHVAAHTAARHGLWLWLGCSPIPHHQHRNLEGHVPPMSLPHIAYAYEQRLKEFSLFN